MAKAKKSETQTSNSDQAEARPIGQGHDPLAEGNTLVNPSNTEAETHYDVKERSEDVTKASQIDGQNANVRVEEHNTQAAVPVAEVPNSTDAEQEEVAAGRVEPGEESAPEEETPSEEAAETPAEEASEPEVPAEVE